MEQPRGQRQNAALVPARFEKISSPVGQSCVSSQPPSRTLQEDTVSHKEVQNRAHFALLPRFFSIIHLESPSAVLPQETAQETALAP